MTRWIVAALAALALAWSGWASAGEVYRLEIKGMACPFCAYGLEKKLRSVEGVEHVEVSVGQGIAVVTADDGAKFDEETARRLTADAGFTLRSFRQVGRTD